MCPGGDRGDVVIGCEWLCINPCRLVWIYLYGLIESHSIVDEAFEEVLNDYPDLRDALELVSHSSDSQW